MDFVFIKNGIAIPIEIRSGSAIPGRYPRSFHWFLNRFSPESAIYLNKEMFRIDEVGYTRVFSIPTHWFLLFGIDMLGDIQGSLASPTSITMKSNSVGHEKRSEENAG